MHKAAESSPVIRTCVGANQPVITGGDGTKVNGAHMYINYVKKQNKTNKNHSINF